MDKATGWIEGSFSRWVSTTGRYASSSEVAAGYEEWADYFELQLAQRADEDHHDVLARWVDDVAYCCRRAACAVRGEEPGPWVPQWERRPDLTANRRRSPDGRLALVR